MKNHAKSTNEKRFFTSSGSLRTPSFPGHSPDGSLAQLPAWMLREAAALLGLRPEPRFPLEVLRSLRAKVDALLGFLPSESDLEKGGDDADFRAAPQSCRKGPFQKPRNRLAHPFSRSVTSEKAADREVAPAPTA